MREIVFDTETTGLDPRSGDRMVEIGCIEMVNRVPTGRTFHAYFNPDRPMPIEWQASAIEKASFGASCLCIAVFPQGRGRDCPDVAGRLINRHRPTKQEGFSRFYQRANFVLIDMANHLLKRPLRS